MTQLVTGCASSLFGGDVEPAGNSSLVGDLGKTISDTVTGRNIVADVPYLKELPWVGATVPDERAARALFQEAEQKFKQEVARKEREKDYKPNLRSIRSSFEKAAEQFPDSSLHEDALFRIAECHFFEDEYPKAFEAYEVVLVSYKRSRHLDTIVSRQFAIGLYWQNVHRKSPENFTMVNIVDKTRPLNDTKGHALRAFEKVRLNHPTGSLADDSLMATAGEMFVRERFMDADYSYTLLRREYPNSVHQFQAHLLGIQAKIRSYQGPQYDGTPLVEAKELIQQTLKQFRKMTPENRERLQELYAQVISNLAIRDFEMARFYDIKEFYGAAKDYYKRVIRDYPRTSAAKDAQARIAELQGEPDVPPHRLTWLSGLFPEEVDDKLKLEKAPIAGRVSPPERTAGTYQEPTRSQ
ncbi:MAG: outer membrane protein assembly factor BamD [Planctomycetales bacterium]